MDLSKMVMLGKELGLEGEELTNFVERKEKELLERELNKEREMREWSEQKERERLEREERREKDAAERAERAQAREDHIRQIEMENENKLRLAELECNHELEMKEKEIELEKAKAINVEGKVKSSLSKTDIKGPKLPPFEEGKDDIDAYLQRFERVATMLEWPQEEWVLRLSSLLKGKSLEVYCRMSKVEADDYEKVRDALLRRFELTQEGFRQKFRTSRPEIGESAPQFASRIENYLLRWVELSNADKTFNALKDLLLREQFLDASDRDLALFLKERKPMSINEMSELAEQYLEAHNSTFMNQNDGMDQGRKQDVDEIQVAKDKVVEIDKGKGNSKLCYFCKKPGHQISDCFERQRVLKLQSVKRTAGLLSIEEEEDNMRHT